MIKLPGLIDIHVHFRDPGETHKEDFFTGTMAALSGGYTTVIDMPNNKKPIITLKTLKEKISLAKKKIVCDIGFMLVV
jgi:Dihydroorotase and related cyclic amidohydrolases